MNRTPARLALLCALALAACAGKDSARPTSPQPMKPNPAPERPTPPASRPASLPKTDAEWRAKLSDEQYRVLRQSGTERPFGAAYEEFHAQGKGTYVCAGCGAELFTSEQKFDSGCGWPSFYDPANAQNVRTIEDRSGGMVRVEVRCAICDGHLGHVFKGEGFPTPTDTRFCINGVSLTFVPNASQGTKR